MQVRKVLKRRIRRVDRGATVTGDVQAVVAVNGGRSGSETRASSSQQIRVRQGRTGTGGGRSG